MPSCVGREPRYLKSCCIGIWDYRCQTNTGSGPLIPGLLHERLLSEGDFVSYRLDEDSSSTFSLCPDFLTDEEEFVPAVYVMRAFEQGTSISDFDRYIQCCDRLGARGVRNALDRLIVCDDILANSDRHFRNFGIVRNMETLECRPAPIFDSGTSLGASCCSHDRYC